jgi:membrane protein required for colicin V production
MPITAMDIIIVAIMLLSGLFALLRGFVREVFTIVTWIGGVFTAFYFLPYLGGTFRNFITVGWIADLLAFALPFFTVFFALSYVSSKLVKNISGTDPGPIDGTMGFFFGIVRGFIIVTVAYFGFDVFMNPERTPDWLERAKFKPMIEDTTEFYYSLIPNLKGDEASSRSQRKSSTASSDQKTTKENESGYSDQERDAIDQLFQSSSGD